MERHHNFCGASVSSLGPRPWEGRGRAPELVACGSAINFLSNLRFRPTVAFKMASATIEMEDKKEMLSGLALLVSEVGLLGLRSSEELKDMIFQHFGNNKHELYVYRSHPDPFLVLFPDRHSRDVVFAAGRVIDGPIEVKFKAWDIVSLGFQCWEFSKDPSRIPQTVFLTLMQRDTNVFSGA
jgi:hypothetical protein